MEEAEPLLYALESATQVSEYKLSNAERIRTLKLVTTSLVW